MEDELNIELKSSQKLIIKIGFVFQGLLILVTVLGLIYFGLVIMDDITLLSLFSFGCALFFLYISRNYFNNVFFKERLTITREKIIIINRKLGEEKKHEIYIRDVIFFYFAGNFEYTEHPMNNPIIDFTGLGVGEKELQYLIDDGKIIIETHDEVFRFGKNTTSWDAEDVINQIENFTGIKFESKNINKEY